MLPFERFPEDQLLINSMTECTAAMSPVQSPAGTGQDDVGCSPQSAGFMTQAARRQGKRKSIIPVGISYTYANEADKSEEQQDEQLVGKRLKLSEDVPPVEEATGTKVDSQFKPPEQQPCVITATHHDGQEQEAGHRVPKDGHGSTKTKSMLEVVFSPLFSVFNRNHHTEAIPDSAAQPRQEGALAEEPEDEENTCTTHVAAPENGEQHEQHATCGANHALPLAHVGTHAHHPPPPDVPEAAESELDEDEDDFVDFDPLLFIKTLPPLEQCIPKYRQALLPRQTRQCKQKTLVLDLDETLVHSSLEHTSASDFSFEVHFNNQEHTIHVKQRPHLHEFMQSVAERFEVVVFTASQKVYAEKLLNVIDPKRTLIKHRIYRESCVVVDGNYLKDLTVLGRDLRSTFIVDNSPQAFGFQPNNGIPIESWYDDERDTELVKLLPFLHSLADVDDVRPHIASKFRLKELIDKITL